MAKGVKPGINRNDVYSIQCPIPPLPEQQRIVAILDEALAGVATAVAHTERNLQNAKELFESYLNGVFANPGEGWEEIILREVTEVKDGTHDTPKYKKEGIPFVTQKNIRASGLSFSNVRYISEEDHVKFFRRSNVTNGDILISMIGANRGMVCLVDDDRTFSIKNVGLIKASDKFHDQYLLYYLKSGDAKMYIDVASRGGAQQFISLKKLREFPVVIAPMNEQLRIASKLDALAAEVQRLEAIYRQKLAALDELKKSILQEAFSGEL
ncbi:MAG: restriction endonuclease subunit S [Gammaproteobacteria bacterium]|nr:restriction endonuclease subunit S [Gammaproteobacteria bacterium]